MGCSMFRIVFGSALPVLSLGIAASFLGGGILNPPRGEPLVVAAPADARLQPASFDGEGCPSPLFFDETPALRHGFVGFAVRSSGEGIQVFVEDVRGGAPAQETIVLVFDAEGRLTDVKSRPKLPAVELDCLALPDAEAPGPV